MTKTLSQFARDTLGGRFGNPSTNNANLGDPAYAGQCVSYVRLYMEEVLGIKTAVWGHAVAYWTNPAVLEYFDKVSSPEDGDIVVWGDDAGSWTTEYGHIAIWYKGQILNQNFGGSLLVSLDPMFTPGLLGYLRPKEGGELMLTNQQLNVLWRFYLGKAPTKAQRNAYVGKKSFAEAQEIAMDSQTFKGIVADAKTGKLKVTDHLPAALRGSYKPSVDKSDTVTKLKPGLYEVN